MKKKLLTAISILTVVALHQSCGGSKDEQQGTTDVVSEIKPDPKCANAPASWFASATTAAPDDNGPFVDSSKTSDCDFHLWSWQKFLSLTRSATVKAPFENLILVSNDLDSLGSGSLLLSDSSQAVSKATLYDKNNRAIYYSIYVNQEMYDFQKKYLPEFEKHIKNLEEKGYNTLTYPVGCVEIKAAWIRVSSLKDPQNYYVTSANLTTASGTSTVQVALIGMHLLGRVANHPELIWSTFEHDSLAPDYDWKTDKKDTTSTVLSKNNYLFYNKNTTVSNCPMNSTSQSPAGFTNVFNMFPNGMAESFTSNNLPSHRDSANDVNIKALNKSVISYLASAQGPWKNYFYKGAIWLDDPSPAVFYPGNPNMYFLTNPFLRGSRAISNITMETFLQLDYSDIYATGSSNCFDCHSTMDFKNDTVNGIGYNLAISHLFINALYHRLHPKAAKTP